MQRIKVSVQWLAVAALVVLLLIDQAPQAGSAAPSSAPAPAMYPEVFPVSCASLPAVTPAYAKLADLGTFEVAALESIVEVTYNGRIFVGSFASGTGAVFELRVDDMPTPFERARANLRAAEAGGGGVQASISGIFTGLPAGEHTASMWVRASTGGSGSQAMVDPGCWSTDVLIVRQYLPYGFTFLPALQN